MPRPVPHRPATPPEFGALTDSKRVGERRSAHVALPLILEAVPGVSSVVQVGIGAGAWLAEAGRLGIETVAGVDGPWAPPDAEWPPGIDLIVADYTAGFDLGRRWDLCLCIEVAEHLPVSRAPSFVADLTRMAPVVAFSAAIPGQGGEGHINEQWPHYWERLFAASGYRMVDALRRSLWRRSDGPAYVAQNLFVAVEESELRRFPLLAQRADADLGPAMGLVHPDIWMAAVRPSSVMGIRDAAGALRGALTRRLRRSVNRLPLKRSI
jgi:hypothetical protein